MFSYFWLVNGPIPMRKTFHFFKKNLTELKTHLESWLEEPHWHGIRRFNASCKFKSNIWISFLEVLSYIFPLNFFMQNCSFWMFYIFFAGKRPSPLPKNISLFIYGETWRAWKHIWRVDGGRTTLTWNTTVYYQLQIWFQQMDFSWFCLNQMFF